MSDYFERKLSEHKQLPLGTAEILADRFAERWDYAYPDIQRVGMPFEVRTDNPNVHHIFADAEYLVVHSEMPYGKEQSWLPEIKEYKMHAVASRENVTLYEVPEGMVALPALLNDAIEGDPQLIFDVFSEVGVMAKKFKTAANIAADPILPKLRLADIAFIKGKREPILLPPLKLYNGAVASYNPIDEFAKDVIRATRDDYQEDIVVRALEALVTGNRGNA